MPSEEPSCCGGVLQAARLAAVARRRPPTGRRCRAGRRSGPSRSPSTPIAIRNEVVVELAARSCRAAAASTTKTIARPTRTSGRAGKRVASAEPARAADEEADRGGQHPHPGLERVEALDDLQVERDREEDPHQDQVLGEQHRRRRRAASGSRSRRKWTQRVLAAAPRGAAPRRGSRRGRAPPAAITNGVSEKPNGSIGELRGRSQPQLLACRTPRTISAEAERGEHRADPVEARRAARLALGLARSAGCRAGSPIATTTSPAKTTRQLSSVVAQPPRIGPTAIPAPATPPSTP